jgi:hypothetical protein
MDKTFKGQSMPGASPAPPSPLFGGSQVTLKENLYNEFSLFKEISVPSGEDVFPFEEILTSSLSLLDGL